MIVQTETEWFTQDEPLSPELNAVQLAGGSRHALYIKLDDILALEHLSKDHKEWLLYLKGMYAPFVLMDESGADLFQKWQDHDVA